MLDPEGRKTERKVLEVYQKENPSTYPIELDEKQFQKNRQFAERLYIHSLKILPQAFRGADLLEFGSGTGERSLNYLLWGARGTFVEMNEKALERAKKLYDHFVPDSEYNLVNSSLFDFESDRKFDITISNGVIHHTPDKEKAFAKQVSHLKPGGINVLGIGNIGACIQRNLQRFIVYFFAGRDEEEITRVAEDLFTEHLNRAEKYGGRKRKAIIYDTYVNPKMDFISVSDVLDWYKTYGLRFYSSWPPVTPPVLADDLAGLTDWRKFPELLSRPEWIWGTQITMDNDLLVELDQASASRSSSFRTLARSLNDVEAENLHPSDVRDSISDVLEAFLEEDRVDVTKIRNFIPWLHEIDGILAALEKKSYEDVSKIVKNSSLLFRGKGGMGLTYFAALKE
ncbi:MAG: class I SAM-dependent methyltransferase [Balneolaceae bacterium]